MTNRFAETLSSLWSEISGRGRIQRLCAEKQWNVDEQNGDNFTLYFKDKIASKRNLYIHGGDEALIRFYAYSFMIGPADEAPDELPAFLLKRNSELSIGKWEAVVDDEGDLLLRLSYSALGDGMTADVLQLIASSLLGE